MKSKFNRIIVLILLVLCYTNISTASISGIIGDANDDGMVNLADVMTIVSYILNDEIKINSEMSDVNHDGRIGMTDIMLVVNMILDGEKQQTAIDKVLPDTLTIKYTGEEVLVHNPSNNLFAVSIDKTDVTVSMTSGVPNCVVSVSGKCGDGRLRVIADTTYTLHFAGLELTSKHAPAVNSSTKQKVTVVLEDNTVNVIEDSKKYIFTDTLEKANACFCSQGNITFSGGGSLMVKANYKHGIASGKGLRLKHCNMEVVSAPSDALHSDKYITIEKSNVSISGQKQDGMDAGEDVEITGGTINISVLGNDAKAIKCGTDFMMNDGNVFLSLSGKASKGIKTKGNITILGGSIYGTSDGDIEIENGDPSYCTIIKGDADMHVMGGKLHLISNGAGGKCISVDKNMTIDSGTFVLETYGDGAEYANAFCSADYYTAKCISVDGNLTINGGNIDCHSTGLGGKGIVVEGNCNIGIDTDDSPVINIITEGQSIINDNRADERYGCPKAFKVNGGFQIYSTVMTIYTKGMGGEGIECNDHMCIYGGKISCNTYDDGINVGKSLNVYDGYIYCLSQYNDGIDSNGGICINGGFLMSQSQSLINESYDTEEGNLRITGGIVIGLAPSDVDIAFCGQPYYCTQYTEISQTQERLSGIAVEAGKEYIIECDGYSLFSIKSEITTSHAFFFFSTPKLEPSKKYNIIERTKEHDRIVTSFIPTRNPNYIK